MNKKAKMISRIAEDIIDNCYERDYRELAIDLVKDGLKNWSVAELNRYLGEE